MNRRGDFDRWRTGRSGPIRSPELGEARMSHPRLPVAVHVLLVRGDEVLLVRRRNTGFEDGKLSVVAGHVEPGEPVTRAALRETHEEVGVALSPEGLRVVGVIHRKS